MESNHRSWSSYITTWEVAEELNINRSRVIWCLKWIGKVKRLNKWEPHELTKNQKNCHFEVLSSFILHNNLWTTARLDCDMWQKEDFIWWPARWLDWEEAPSTSQSQTCSKAPGHCLVVWFQSGLLQLSESQRNHYIWEVCSANRWDAPKTAKPTASIVNNNMDPILLTTSVSEVEWIGSRTKFCLICHVHVTSRQAISSSNISTTFCRKKASTPSRRQKMLLKNLLKSEAQFLHCRSKLISHWQKCIDSSVQFSSVVSKSLWPHEPVLPVYHQLLESTQTHVHRVGDAIQPSHPLSSPSPPAPNLSQHQGLLKWVSSSHQVGKVLEFQLQHQSFQWTPRTDLL